MSAFLTQQLDKMKNFWGGISVSQRVLVSGIAIFLVVLFFVLIMILNKTPMGTLYANLSPEDANRVVQSLEAQKVNFSLVSGGTEIKVPEDMVYSLRVRLAGEGTLQGNGQGFEIFDTTSVGETDFVQGIKYQRALQGELARTIAAFPGIESARVHLVLPKRSLFLEDQAKPSAAVVLQVQNGANIDQKEVNAIVSLVSMSVQRLEKERISVTDSQGRTLFQPEESGSLSSLTNSQNDMRTQTRRTLESNIEELFSRIVGVGRVMAKVDVDLNFNQRTSKIETYDPDTAGVISERRTEQSTTGRANIESGSPDINFRGDGISGSVSDRTHTSETRDTNYVMNHKEENIVDAPGSVNRITVSVIVDGTYTTGENGESIYTPRTEEELATYKALVANAVGFESARGDSIEISCVPFGAPELGVDDNLGSLAVDYAFRLGKPLLSALLIFLFLIIVVRPVVMAMIRPKVEGEMLEELAGLPLGEERLALLDGRDEEEMDALAVLEKIEDIKVNAMQLSEQNMDQAMGIIRNWMKVGTPDKAAA